MSTENECFTEIRKTLSRSPTPIKMLQKIKFALTSFEAFFI
jgi:hypothetical protein